MHKEKPYQEGRILLVNKPLEWTSFDVVKKLRNKLKVKKIGHAGTLDPLATGLLILCTGKKTKEIEHYQVQEKEYTGTLMLGKTTPSYDLETPVNSVSDISHITNDQIKETASRFEGRVSQTPPVYSAVKIDGKRAYESARKGENVELKAREVHIEKFEITGVSLPEISFKVICSKGTYIRSLVRDFGELLGVGAYLSSLCRTRIGKFKLSEAKSIEEINL